MKARCVTCGKQSAQCTCGRRSAPSGGGKPLTSAYFAKKMYQGHPKEQSEHREMGEAHDGETALHDPSTEGAREVRKAEWVAAQDSPDDLLTRCEEEIAGAHPVIDDEAGEQQTDGGELLDTSDEQSLAGALEEQTAPGQGIGDFGPAVWISQEREDQMGLLEDQIITEEAQGGPLDAPQSALIPVVQTPIVPALVPPAALQSPEQDEREEESQSPGAQHPFGGAP